MGYMVNLNTGSKGYIARYFKGIEETIVSFTEPTRYFMYEPDGSCYDTVTYGFCGPDLEEPSFAMSIMQFVLVQKMFDVSPRREDMLYCECFCIPAQEFQSMNLDRNILLVIAEECALSYGHEGFQVFYSVHINKAGKVLFHFLVNPVNFVNGKNWRCYLLAMMHREDWFNEIIRKHMCNRLLEPIIVTPICYETELIQGVQ